MFTLNQSLWIKGSAGDPLPKVWDDLEARFLRGQLALICAGPGVGKSAMILTYALKAKVPTLYFSADSDSFTQLSRAMSILTGWELSKTTSMVRQGDLGEAEQYFTDIPIRFNYDASPTLDQIEMSMKSYEEVYGDYPALVIVDNITNVITGSKENADNPFEGLEAMMDVLHGLARRSEACIVGLHHVTGGYNDANKITPLSAVKNQIGRVPELILTLHKVTDEFGPASLCVSTVKNRAGKADPSGHDFITLDFYGNTMQIRNKN